MPKLLVASGIFHPEAGGPATYLRSILPALQGLGWQVRVLSYGDGKGGDYPYTVTRIAREVYPLRRAKYGLAAWKQLAWADMVYAQTIDLPLWGGRNLPRVLKIVGDQAWERCIRRGWIAPDMTVDEFQRFTGDWRARWQKRSRSRQVADMDVVIVPSHYLKRMVIAWGVNADKVRVIGNALAPISQSVGKRAELAAALGWDDLPTIVTVARLQPWKGIDHLIDAIAEMPGIRLVVVGDGPDRGRLEARARGLGERVQFTGRLDPEEVQRRLVAADGLALYSGYEGLSHTLLESLRLGTPVLASDVGGNAEVVRHGVNGVLTPHVELGALRAGIAELIDRRDEFAANCALGIEDFSLERMARETDALLRSALA